MTIYEEVKKVLQYKNTLPGMRKIYQLILGDFARVNDGKPLDDTEAVKILKKMIKSNKTTQGYLNGSVEIIAGKYERRVMEQLLPTVLVPMATKMDMLKAIANSVPPGAKNRMSCMKPCIQYLEARNLTVDKKALSGLLRSGE